MLQNIIDNLEIYMDIDRDTELQSSGHHNMNGLGSLPRVHTFPGLGSDPRVEAGTLYYEVSEYYFFMVLKRDPGGSGHRTSGIVDDTAAAQLCQADEYG